MAQENWESLINKAKKGDQNAYNKLIHRIEPDIKKICHSYFSSNEDAEDAEQESYFIIYRSLAGLGRAPIRDPGKFRAWAKKITRNECLNILGKLQVQLEH